MAFDPFSFVAQAGGGLGFTSSKDIRATSGNQGGNIAIQFGNSGGKGNKVDHGGGAGAGPQPQLVGDPDQCIGCLITQAAVAAAALIGVVWLGKKVLK